MLNGKKVTVPNTKNQIFDFVYLLSMREAVSRKAFAGNKKDLIDITGAKDAVKDYIDDVLDGKLSSVRIHDDAFLETAIAVCDSINKVIKSPKFTFGNAQKLINMVVKHFYIIFYHNPSVRTLFEFCHCPVDSQMLENVWGLMKNYPSLEIKPRKTEFCSSWSKEDFAIDNGSRKIPERYAKFQRVVREVCKVEGCIPIEVDYYLW